MCGLAGWNVSKQYADEHFTDELVQTLCKVGFERNLHRGKDAAGWVASNYIEESNKAPVVQYWKSPGPASKSVIEKGPYPSAKASSVLLHTRAKTQHDPSDNDNNHPVVQNEVLTVHNGNIRNHVSIRNRLKLGAKPLVDSWIISAIVDLMPKPNKLDLTEIVDMASSFDGSYVFMTMWAKRPRHVLLVKGPERELWVAQNEHAIFWSSEPDGLYELVDLMPDPESFKIGPLDDGQVLMLNNGKVQETRAFETKKHYQNGAKVDATIRRVHDKFDFVLDENDTKYHWTNDDSPLTIYDADLSDANVLLLDPTDEKVMRALPTSWPPGFYTADEIWCWTPPGTLPSVKHIDSRYYILMGDVEFVTTNHSSVKDVYDWSDVAEEDRGSKIFWEPVPRKESTMADADYKDPKQFRVVSNFEFKDLGGLAMGRRESREKKQHRIPIGGGIKKDASNVDLDTQKADATGKIAWIGGNKDSVVNVELDDVTGEWKVMLDNTVIRQHVDKFWFVFQQEIWCKDHSQWLTKHENPDKCEFAIAHTLDTMSRLVCVEDFEFVYGFEAVSFTASRFKGENPMHVCRMRPVSFKIFGSGKTRLRLPTRDTCRNVLCGSTMSLDWSATEEPFKTLEQLASV